MDSNTFPRLLGDIGGTNARFAWQQGPGAPLSDITGYPAADWPTLQDAMGEYLRAHGKPVPAACAIGIANPITGDRVQMTNHHWSFSIAAVQQAMGFGRFLVINDFTALAMALPALPPQELLQVGGAAPQPEAPIGLIGPGTGLGVSGLLTGPGGRGLVPINGEGGHVTLAGADGFEDAAIAVLRRRFGHASAERALSGPGLVNLYHAVCEIEGAAAQPFSAADVSAGDDPACQRAVGLFFSLLGSVAGNLALTLGARGGMYIGGGIVPRLFDRIGRSPLRERFESKGRFRAYLEAIPIFVVNSPTSPALLGASRALDHL